MQVYDRDGRLIEIDGDVCPEGYSVRPSVLLLDAEQRAVAAAGDDDDFEQRYDDICLRAAATKAYDARSERMTQAWKRSKPHNASNAGPWGQVGDRKPAWMQPSGGKVPAVGPTGRSPYRGQHQDRAAEAYQARSDDLSTRWRTHRRPVVGAPENGEG